MVVAHTFNPSAQEAESGDLCEFEAILVYRVTARSTQRNLVSKNRNKKLKVMLGAFFLFASIK